MSTEAMNQDEIIEMARQALKQEPREDWNSNAWVFADETLKAFAALVAAKLEVEECEWVVEELLPDADRADCAEAIRARGQA